MGSQEARLSNSNEQAHTTGSCLTVCAVQHVERDLNQGQLQVGLKARPSAQSANQVCAALARARRKQSAQIWKFLSEARRKGRGLAEEGELASVMFDKL